MSDSASEPAPPNPETVIWRYMDDWKFEDLLQWFTEHDQWQTPNPGTRTAYPNDPGQLWFGFPNSFGDNKEGAFPAVNEDPETYCDRMANLLQLSQEEAKARKDRFLAADTQTIRDCNRDMAQLCGVSCWTARDVESRSMWDDFVGNPNGVAIRSTCQRLQQALGDLGGVVRKREILSIRKVAYVDHGTYLLQHDGYRGLLSIVQACHSHENEVRVICDSPALTAITTPKQLKVAVADADANDPAIVFAAMKQRLDSIALEVSQAYHQRASDGFHLPVALPELLCEVVLKCGCAADYEATVRNQLTAAGLGSVPVRHSSL